MCKEINKYKFHPNVLYDVLDDSSISQHIKRADIASELHMCVYRWSTNVTQMTFAKVNQDIEKYLRGHITAISTDIIALTAQKTVIKVSALSISAHINFAFYNSRHSRYIWSSLDISVRSSCLTRKVKIVLAIWQCWHISSALVLV